MPFNSQSVDSDRRTHSCDGSHFWGGQWPPSLVRPTKDTIRLFGCVSRTVHGTRNRIHPSERYVLGDNHAEDDRHPGINCLVTGKPRVVTALWKRNSLIMWKYLKGGLFTAVEILKGNPAPLPPALPPARLLMTRRVLQRVIAKDWSNLRLVEKIILSKREGGGGREVCLCQFWH